ncbi:hypothetical protein HK096_002545 [Nowakowskiella sp. JEL0078]|nr:hypothetical protein HK096_002545 [Nowakowskiella sp. JEL0078]
MSNLKQTSLKSFFKPPQQDVKEDLVSNKRLLDLPVPSASLAEDFYKKPRRSEKSMFPKPSAPFSLAAFTKPSAPKPAGVSKSDTNVTNSEYCETELDEEEYISENEAKLGDLLDGSGSSLHSVDSHNAELSLQSQLADYRSLHQCQNSKKAASTSKPPSEGSQHIILCNIPADGSISRVSHNTSFDLWDDKHVKLPCSPRNRYKLQNGQYAWKWILIKDALERKSTLAGPEDIEEIIMSYNSNPSTSRWKWDFSGLNHYLSELSDNPQELLEEVIPKMMHLAVRLPELIKQPIPLLLRMSEKAVTFNQIQIASLLANAFFCTFPFFGRGGVTSNSKFPIINFKYLFQGDRNTGMCHPVSAAKLSALFHYFTKIVMAKLEPKATITFQRVSLCEYEAPNWETELGGLADVEIRTNGTIEDDGLNMLQLDFANKLIGGGTLTSGAVQEEILFVINPELIASMLITEQLHDNECLHIFGTERFSNYTGYSKSLKWDGEYTDLLSFDDWGRKKRHIVAIDALDFGHYPDKTQFERDAVERELLKTYCGFLPSPLSPLPETADIATGNWGCGAFGGDKELKSIIQLLAHSVARKKSKLVYFTFGEFEFAELFEKLLNLLNSNNVTVGSLFVQVLAYVEKMKDFMHYERISLFDFLMIVFQ